LDDGIGLVLLLEGVLSRIPKRMLGHIIQITNAGRLAGIQELLAGRRHEEGLHELPRLRDIEEGAVLRLLPHLDDLLPGAVVDVREGPERDLDLRVLLLLDVPDDGFGQLLDLGQGLLRRSVSRRHRPSSGSTSANASLSLRTTRSRISSVSSPPVARRASSWSWFFNLSSSAPARVCSARATSSM